MHKCNIRNKNIETALKIGRNFNKMTYGNDRGLSAIKMSRCHTHKPEIVIVSERRIVGLKHPIRFIDRNRF